MLRTYVYERTYVVLKYDRRLKYPLCYDPLYVTTPWLLQKNLGVEMFIETQSLS